MALEEQLDVMAQYYGWSSFSMRNFVWSALRDGMHTALGLSECHFLAALFHDPIHPSLLTAWLLGDALVQHFVDAQAHFEQQEAEDAAAAASSPPRLPLRLPAEALTPGGRAAPPPRTCVPAERLNVTASRSCAFAATEVVRGRTVQKPGWISSAPDAFLEVNISTVLAQPVPGRPRVSLFYLRSYGAEMGVAALACAGGCVCDGAAINARNDDEHVSLHHAHLFYLSAAAVDMTNQAKGERIDACILRLDIVNATTAGSTKFKVLGLSVSPS